MPTQAFTSSGTWTAPSGVTSVTVECWGGGGGGGAARTWSETNPSPPPTFIRYPGGGAGGAGGAYAKKVITVIPGTSYTVTVGAGGTGGNASSNTSIPPVEGTNGGDSWFSTTGTVIAKGGAFGASYSIDNTDPQPGLGTTTGSIGDVVYKGGDGWGDYFNYGGGGGGGAGSTGNGNSTTTNIGGLAQSLNGGAGGTGPTAGGNGGSGSVYGGAGAGGTSTTVLAQINVDGGSGAQGYVTITWDSTSNFFSFF